MQEEVARSTRPNSRYSWKGIKKRNGSVDTLKYSDIEHSRLTHVHEAGLGMHMQSAIRDEAPLDQMIRTLTRLLHLTSAFAQYIAA